MKELYTSPVSEVKEFESVDVLTASGIDIGDDPNDF